MYIFIIKKMEEGRGEDEEENGEQCEKKTSNRLAVLVSMEDDTKG